MGAEGMVHSALGGGRQTGLNSTTRQSPLATPHVARQPGGPCLCQKIVRALSGNYQPFLGGIYKPDNPAARGSLKRSPR